MAGSAYQVYQAPSGTSGTSVSGRYVPAPGSQIFRAEIAITVALHLLRADPPEVAKAVAVLEKICAPQKTEQIPAAA